MPQDDIGSDRFDRSSFLKNKFQDTTSFQRLCFFAEDSRFTMKNVALAAKLAAALYLVFSVLDYLVYPEFFTTFLILRIVCAALVLTIGYFSSKKWARRRYRLFAMLVPLTAAFFIAIMIYLVKDPRTLYYAGLNLCIVGTGTLFQWTSREAMITSIMVFIMYFAATIPSLSMLTAIEALTVIGANCLFIISTSILVIVGAYNHNNFRFDEFVVRSRLRKNQADLAEKNLKLQETLKTLRETEKQLYQSEKMSFLGELSAGVIHEIGNPLNYTNQALFILRKRLSKCEDDVKATEILNDMQEGLDRIRAIVSDLREFSHTGRDIGETFSAEKCFESAIRMLRKPIRETEVSVSIDLPEGMEIKGVKNQITQVVANLIHNGIQALKEVDYSRELLIQAYRTEDGGAVISISDNGPGISQEDQKLLFNPFFTTKDPGEGTGLGLSICYRIIEAHGGKIEVESVLGEGTTFKVLLPA